MSGKEAKGAVTEPGQFKVVGHIKVTEKDVDKLFVKKKKPTEQEEWDAMKGRNIKHLPGGKMSP